MANIYLLSYIKWLIREVVEYVSTVTLIVAGIMRSCCSPWPVLLQSDNNFNIYQAPGSDQCIVNPNQA